MVETVEGMVRVMFLPVIRDFHGQFGGPRAIFNRVSSTSGDMMHGMLEASRTLARHGIASSWSEPPAADGRSSKGYVSGELHSGPGQGLSGSSEPQDPVGGQGQKSKESSVSGPAGQQPARGCKWWSSWRWLLRQLWLYLLASQARKRLVLFLKEHPRDPEKYKAKDDTNEYPSFYAWPEWQEFRSRFHLTEVRLDLGALGHSRRKPTTLGTNIPHLTSFEV